MSGSYLFEDKVALVTGASSGIGRSTAVALARKGVRVVATGRDEAKLLVLADEVRSLGIPLLYFTADVSDRQEAVQLVRRTVEHFGRIDLLICSAGIYPRGAALNLSPERFQDAMSVNFYGTLYTVYAALPYMLAQQAGHIVAVSSVDGKKGLPLDAAYVASKFALTGFLDVLRQELHGSGVHISTILPGRVDTPMIAGISLPAVSAPIPSERVARAIVKAVEKRKTEVFVPYFSSRTIVLVAAFSPKLADFLIRIFRLEGTTKSP